MLVITVMTHTSEIFILYLHPLKENEKERGENRKSYVFIALFIIRTILLYIV